eukprot:432320-Pelagomonas_calceolata.AAC.2
MQALGTNIKGKAEAWQTAQVSHAQASSQWLAVGSRCQLAVRVVPLADAACAAPIMPQTAGEGCWTWWDTPATHCSSALLPISKSPFLRGEHRMWGAVWTAQLALSLAAAASASFLTAAAAAIVAVEASGFPAFPQTADAAMSAPSAGALAQHSGRCRKRENMKIKKRNVQVLMAELWMEVLVAG